MTDDETKLELNVNQCKNPKECAMSLAEILNTTLAISMGLEHNNKNMINDNISINHNIVNNRNNLELTIYEALNQFLSLNKHDVRCISIVRSSMLLIKVFNILWDNNNVDVIMINNSKIKLINNLGSVKLLQWAILADEKIDANTIFFEAINTILNTEKKLMSIKAIKKWTSIEFNYLQAKNQVADAITILFLIGSWEYVLLLLNRCFKDTDEVTNVIIKAINTHFPPSLYDYSNCDQRNHPLYNYSKIKALINDLHMTLQRGACLISKNHILLPLLSLLLNKKKYSNFTSNETEIEIDTYESHCQNIDKENVMYDKNRMYNVAPEPLVNSLFVSPMTQFFIEYYWFRDQFEIELNISTDNKDYFAGAFKNWSEAYLPQHEELDINVICYVYILNNELLLLLNCLYHNCDQFIAMFPVLISIFLLFTIKIPLSLIRKVLILSAKHLIELHLDLSWSYDIEMQIKKLFYPYRKVIEYYLSITEDDDEEGMQLEDELPLQINCIWEYIVYNEIMRCVKPETNKVFDSIRLQYLTTLLTDRYKYNLQAIYIVFEIIMLLNNNLKAKTVANYKDGIYNAKLPDYFTNSLNIVQNWTNSLTINHKSEVINSICASPSFIDKVIEINQSVLYIYKANILLTQAMFELCKFNNDSKLKLITIISCVSLLYCDNNYSMEYSTVLYNILDSLKDDVSINTSTFDIIVLQLMRAARNNIVNIDKISLIINIIKKLELNKCDTYTDPRLLEIDSSLLLSVKLLIV